MRAISRSDLVGFQDFPGAAWWKWTRRYFLTVVAFMCSARAAWERDSPRRVRANTWSARLRVSSKRFALNDLYVRPSAIRRPDKAIQFLIELSHQSIWTSPRG